MTDRRDPWPPLPKAEALAPILPDDIEPHADQHLADGRDPLLLSALDVKQLSGFATLMASLEVDGWAQDVAGSTVTSTQASIISVNLTIPSDWNFWKCYASVSYVFLGSGGSSSPSFGGRLRIDGTFQMETVYSVNEINHREDRSHHSLRTGMTTTGSRAIEFHGEATNWTSATMIRIGLYARGVRVS